ncbi:hypothetical protein EB796_009830 [Bugula neritina]|uniref:Uncharacterized protein n=1 Tax=Bugula neritina TaxID=10212 RepID=A0A7J7K0X8_BUGNE|nr:hypothetical protein EB796_009830 [Bugula neritina]
MIADAIESQINIDAYNHVYVKLGAERGICTAVSVHFAGEKAKEYQQKFSTKSLQPPYRSIHTDTCNKGAIGTAVSSLLMMLSLMKFIL